MVIFMGNDYRNLMNNEHHYVTFNNYLKKRFGDKAYRVSLNVGMTCPNRDGTKSTKGCLYCSNKLSGDFAGDISDSLKVQFEKGVELMSNKWQSSTFIAYLQAGTNTYNTIDNLKDIYNDIINISPNIKVLSIATRPDCINEDIVKLLGEINKKIEVWIELGFQTMHDQTKDYLNCMHHTSDFIKAMNLLNQAQIKTIIHIINGLPYETKEMMIDTIKFVNSYNPFGIKIHMLHIMEHTPLSLLYKEKPFKVLSLNEFVEIVVEQLRHINTNIIIHRLTGDAPKELLIEPKWTLKKFVVLNEIDKYMRKYNYYQGDLC